MSSNNQNTSGSNNHNDPEVEHSSVTEQMNVAFIEQQPLVQDDARLGHSLPSLPSSMESRMADGSWMAAQQLSKPIVVRQFAWTPDSGRGTNLNQFAFPNIIAEAASSIHKETLRMYSFYKFNWVLRFQINGTRFHSGQLIASFDPFIQASDALSTTLPSRPFNIIYATGLPNVLINASSNEPVELKIPFVHPRNFLTTNSVNGFDVLGAIRVNVLNPLRAAEGSSQSLSITIWLYADSPSVHVPIYQHTLQVPDSVEFAVPSMDRVTSMLKGATSAFGNAVAGNVPGLSSILPLASALGLDYPSRPVIEQSHINPLGPMSPGKGVDMSYRLGLDPRGGKVPTPDQTGSTREECDMDFIKKVPMLMQQVTWTDAQAVGTILTNYPVTPNIAPQLNIPYGEGVIQTSGNNFLSWFSNSFCFWKGSLRYKYEWVSTQFHTGRVLIAFIPNWFDGTPTLEQAYSCPNAVVDLQQSSVCTLTIPFVSPTTEKKCSIRNDAKDDETVLGWIYVYVLNQLVHPSNVSDAIEFNIYISGGEDFKFMTPRANGLRTVYQFPASLPAEIARASMGPDRMQARTDGQSTEGDVDISFGQCLVPDTDKFGEEFPLIDVIKRYGLISTDTVSMESSLTALYNNPTQFRNNDAAGAPVATPVDGATQHTPLSSVCAVFACWFGSLRYKITTRAPRSATSAMTVTYNPLDLVVYDGAISGSGNPIQRTNLAQNNSLDVELPCYTNFNLLMLRQPTSLAGRAPFTECGRALVSFRGDTGSGNTQLDVYQAAGDDFRPFYLISPPSDFNGSLTGNYHFLISTL